jgi:sulfur-oxidizing protein SoxY
MRGRRRQVLALAGGGLATALVGPARAQFSPVAGDQALMQRPSPIGGTGAGLTEFLTGGVAPRVGRVKLELPVLAENGNSVPMKVSVDSPMTEADRVRVIHLVSERNPVRLMASFHLGPWSGAAEIVSRVRLAGSQRVFALAQMSDGSFWLGLADVVVTLSACIDES